MAVERDSTAATDDDELWDPSAQRRDLLAMSMDERLLIVAALFDQSHLIARLPDEDR